MSNDIPQEDFERLLTALPRIAEAVNSFSSEHVQRSAFDTLMRELGLPTPSATPTTITPDGAQPDANSDPNDLRNVDTDIGASKEAAPNKRARGTNAKRNFTIPRGLNFAPADKPSLEQVVAEMQPRTQHDKNLLACHYLSEIMQESDIDTGKVLAVYQAASWTAPAHPDTSRQNTASHHGWIDTANMKDIKVVWAGTNHVNKMPTPQKAKKKS